MECPTPIRLDTTRDRLPAALAAQRSPSLSPYLLPVLPIVCWLPAATDTQPAADRFFDARRLRGDLRRQRLADRNAGGQFRLRCKVIRTMAPSGGAVAGRAGLFLAAAIRSAGGRSCGNGAHRPLALALRVLLPASPAAFGAAVDRLFAGPGMDPVRRTGDATSDAHRWRQARDRRQGDLAAGPVYKIGAGLPMLLIFYRRALAVDATGVPAAPYRFVPPFVLSIAGHRRGPAATVPVRRVGVGLPGHQMATLLSQGL